jgi:hypothetical protein
MNSLSYYFDQAKKVTGSDYKTAQLIGLTRSGVSLARRKGNISNEIARKLAEIIGVSPLEVIAAGEVTKDPSKAKLWSKWVAASLILGLGIFAISSPESMAYSGLALLPHYRLCAIVLVLLIVAYFTLRGFKQYKRS